MYKFKPNEPFNSFKDYGLHVKRKEKGSTKEFSRNSFKGTYMHSRSNWNLEMLVFNELNPQRRQLQESNPGHIGGRQVLSPLLHPCNCPIVLFSVIFVVFDEIAKFLFCCQKNTSREG